MSNSTVPEIQPYTVEPVNDDLYQSSTDPYANTAQPIDPNQQAAYAANSYDPTQQSLDQTASYQYQDPYLTSGNGYVETTQTTTRKLPVAFIAIIVGFIILLILGIILIFSGTGRSNTGGGTTGSQQSVVLQWWGVFLSQEVVQPLLDEYKEINPNVTIEYANRWPSGSYTEAEKEYQLELNRTINTNDPVQLPDIFMVHNTWVGDYEPYSQASSTLDLQTFSTTFYPAVTTDFANQGVVYGVPLWLDNLAIIYNRDMLASAQLTEPPTSWPRFKNASQALTKKTGSRIDQAGFAAGLSTNISYSFDIINLLFAQNGVPFLDSENQPVFSSDSDSVDAAAFYKSFASGSTSTWDSTFSNESAAFLEKKVAMIAVPSFRLREILRLNEENNLGIDIGIAQMPQVEGQEESILNWANYWGAMVTKNRPNSVEAWEFLTWITQPEQLQKLSANVSEEAGYFGTLYPRQDMQELLKDDQYLKVYNQSLPFSQSWYMVKGLRVKDLFNDILSGTSISSGTISSLEDDVADVMILKGLLDTTFE